MNDLKNNFLETEDNNITDILKKYLRYWPLFLISVLFCSTLVYLHLRYRAQPLFEISSTILIKNTAAGKGIGEMENFNNIGLLKTSQSLEDEIGILKSSGIMEQVISKNTLNVNFFLEGHVRDVEIFGSDVPIQIIINDTVGNLSYNLPIYIDFIDKSTFKLHTRIKEKEEISEHVFGDKIVMPYGTLTIIPKANFTDVKISKPLYFKISSKDKMISEFVNNLSVFPDNETGSLLRLNFSSNHRKKGEFILSKIIDTYVDNTIAYENELATNTIKMIDDRLKLLSGEIEDVENTVVDFKTRNVVTDVASNANNYITQANDYKNKVTEYQSQINVLDYVEESLTEGSGNIALSSSFASNDGILSNIVENYNEALIEKKRLSQTTPSGNPIIVNLDTTLNNLRNSILQNVQSTKNGLLIAQRNLSSNASRYDAQIAKVPGMEKKLLDISRDKSTKEGLYLFLLQKREEEMLSLAAPVNATRIVNLPKAGIYPVSPNKKMFYLSGLLIGLIIPFSFIYIKEAVNNKIQSIDDLSRLVTAPILGKISRNKNKNALPIEASNDPLTQELFRLLRFNLDYLKQSDKNQTILVTSTIKGEGKTFIAANLAVTLAASGEKVVVLAFDLRVPQLMVDFGLPNSPGITDYIIKKGISFEEIVQRHPTIENLSLIGSGTTTNQPGILMLSKRINDLMEYLKKEYDHIIIDSAPIGLVSDAYALNTFIDSTIYVVRKNVTKKEHIKSLNAIYKSEKLKNCMVLLNDETDAVETYGYV
jgi:capsular exopolysaccharide synthesis family protein